MAVMEATKTAVSVALGRRIKELRKRRGIKQKALGEMLGYKSHTAIVYLESGEQALSVEMALAIARALDISLIELLGDVVLDNSPQEYHDPIEVTLQEDLYTTPKEDCHRVAKIFQTLATVYLNRANA